MENALAGFGKQDEVYRNNSVTVLDITDGLAIVRCESTGVIEHVQMYKGDGQWKLFNCVSRPNLSLTLQEAMTVIAGDPMPGFTLPVYGGGIFDLSDYRGKNVMLIFPRGWTGNNWCSYCPYQYLELEKLEKESKIMAKNNLQVAYVMPYSSDRIQDWMEKFPDALQVVEGIKSPKTPPAAGTIQAEYGEWVKSKFPLVFDVKKDDPHTIIPVLVDENRTLSRQLKLFTNFWDGVSAEQNIASVFIIDKNGILRFKYIGQMTEDRPSVEFLLDYIGKMK
jgi:peroxiredoxin